MLFFPLWTLTGKHKATHIGADWSITKWTSCSKNQTLALGYSSKQKWPVLNRKQAKQMQSSVTIRRENTDAEEGKHSKGKPTFKQLHRHWTHKLNEALTGYRISIWVWEWAKRCVLKTQGSMQTNLKMEIKPLQTTVSPFLDMVKNLTFSGKTVVYIMERT